MDEDEIVGIAAATMQLSCAGVENFDTPDLAG